MSIIFSRKSKYLLDKVKGGEIYEIDHATNESLAIIRHLGGWAVHSVVANLNCYMFSFSINNKTNDLILNLTPENVTQHSRIE